MDKNKSELNKPDMNDDSGNSNSAAVNETTAINNPNGGPAIVVVQQQQHNDTTTTDSDASVNAVAGGKLPSSIGELSNRKSNLFQQIRINSEFDYDDDDDCCSLMKSLIECYSLSVLFIFLSLVKSARFIPTGRLFNTKGDIYVEMIIDGNPARKTEIMRKTWTPQWNENFDV
jgi:hypothetical protein